MHSYVIKGLHVGLRKSKSSDLHFILEAEKAPENSAFVLQNSPEEHLALMKHRDVLHLIIENEKHVPVGYMIVAGVHDRNKAVELRRIVVTEKGNGYGREALSLLIQVTFDDLGANRLWLDVREENRSAQKLYESLGFRYEGTLREAVRFGDMFATIRIYSILRSDLKKVETA